jgi:GAF domain-containing protein
MSVFQRTHRGDLRATVDLLVATAESSDALIDGSVNETLRMMRDKFAMDVVFVSEFSGGKRVLRYVDHSGRGPALPAGTSDPLEASFCQRIVDGRLPELIRDVAALPANADVPPLPFRIGAHMSTPIVLDDGSTYGTLCCFSEAANQVLRDSDLQMLRHTARLVAKKIGAAGKRGVKPPEEWALEPIDDQRVSKMWKLP